MLAEKGRRDDEERSRSLIQKWMSFHRQQIDRNRSEGQLFNPLFLFDIGETKHSQLLGFLLSPHESHGQGSLFLVSFLHMLKVADPEQGEWQVFVEQMGRVDLLLRRRVPRSVVIVENKSHGAVDQMNQLYRYWHRTIHSHYPDLNYASPEVLAAFKLVYLPSGGERPPEEHSLRRPKQASYGKNLPERVPLPLSNKNFRHDIAKWLTEVRELVPEANRRLRTFLEFYSELCRSL